MVEVIGIPGERVGEGGSASARWAWWAKEEPPCLLRR